MMTISIFHIYTLVVIVMFAQLLTTIDLSVTDIGSMIKVNAFAQKEAHDDEHEDISKTKSHVHTTFSAEIAQWVGVGTLIGLPMIISRIRRDKAVLRNAVLLLSVGAGIMHILLAQDHLDVGIAHAMFFAIAGLSQIGFGILFVLKPSKIVSIVGIIGSTANIILYFVTRIEGLPMPFTAPEGIDAIGIITKIIEILLVISLVFLIQKKNR